MKQTEPKGAVIKTKEKPFIPMFDNEALVNVVVKYPEVLILDKPLLSAIISGHYNLMASGYLDYAKNFIYPKAREAHSRLQAAKKPFIPYQAVQLYTVTYNTPPYLSTVTDRFTYTGGKAYSNRKLGDTFDVTTGRKVPLRSLFWDDSYQEVIFDQIRRQIEADKQRFLPLAGQRVKSLFRKKNYYLTEHSLVVFFPSYTLAPGTNPTPSFEIPYKLLERHLKRPL